MLNRIFLMGRLVADPELRQTPNGISVATFRIAVDRNYQNKASGERQTDFISCVAWRQTGEFISRYFSKGRMICVEGSLQSRNYEDKSGQKRTAYEVVADVEGMRVLLIDDVVTTGATIAAAADALIDAGALHVDALSLARVVGGS